MSEHEDNPGYVIDPVRLAGLIEDIEKEIDKDAGGLVETPKLGELIEKLPKDQAERISDALMASTQELAILLIKKTLPVALKEVGPKALEAKVSRLLETNFSDIVPSFLEMVGITLEAVGLIQDIASRTKDSREDVVRKALNLYQLLLDAQDEGNRMAILSPDDTIVHEVVGYELPEKANLQSAGSGSPGR